MATVGALTDALLPAAAGASSIVYQCGAAYDNLCRIDPDTASQHQITTDGAGGAYASPSLSRDGTRLAFVRGTGTLFTSDASAGARVGPISRSALVAYMNPAGTQVADLENFGLNAPVTGALRADLTSGTQDGQPVWSPDGTQIAFARGDAIYVADAGGSPGAEHRLVAGAPPRGEVHPDRRPCRPRPHPGHRLRHPSRRRGPSRPSCRSPARG